MRGRPSPVEAITTLPTLADPAERRARWRQAIAALGQSSMSYGPPPLDGLDPSALVHSCRIALSSGLADDLDWVAADTASLALYELTTALPPGDERREFGRRVFSRIYVGSAGAFLGVATRMAWGAIKQLESATMRARVSLCFSMPLGSGVSPGPLALAFLLRAPHFEAWVARAANGPLPARRLAAVILEYAAREAVRRSQNGDNYPVELLTGPVVQTSYERLLADREPLVWRHAAAARGILAAVEPRGREEIDVQLDPALSPTEWRRAVVSLVACLGHDPETTFAQCRSLIQSELTKRHPGLLETFLWGLGPIVETEPEMAEDLLTELARTGRPELAGSMVDLLREGPGGSFGLGPAAILSSKLNSSGIDSLTLERLKQALRQPEPSREREIYELIHDALLAYENEGAEPAHLKALEALDRAHQSMSQLEQQPRDLHGSPEAWLPTLMDLDASALERSRLYDLLLLGRRPGDQNAQVLELDQLHDKLGKWILRSEQDIMPDFEWTPSAVSARRQKLVSFLHLLDVQTADSRESTDRVRARIRTSIGTLLANIADGPEPAVHRVMCAALARSFDAAIREGAADASDLLLLVLDYVDDEESVQAIMEASTDPGMRDALSAYTKFLALSLQVRDRKLPDKDLANSFVDFSRGVGRHGSRSGEALRQALLRIGRALESVAQARGITQLASASGRSSIIEDLELHLDTQRKLARAAARRVLARRPRAESRVELSTQSPATVIEHSLGAGEQLDTKAFELAVQSLALELAPPIGTIVAKVLARIQHLPVTPPSDVTVIPLKPRRGALPDWLMPRRTIGGFYVVQALGTGGVSSVFVSKRIEERRNPNAETYALKVPEYDPSTARSLSEHEFMDLFRDEAGALLSLPRHTNLARFVNFDAAAKPKPILVMELIQGQSLEKLIKNRLLSVEQALTYLDGILAGLEAMHSVGVAHLDLKPSNVILRDDVNPVLVDFGLSGRQLRPGCGTLEYCAPEILGVVPEGYSPEAVPADLYAFGCLAFELLTSELLFDGDDEVAMMSQHISHDGWPATLAAFGNDPLTRPLAVILGACLRKDPRNRPSAKEVRKAIAAWRAKASVESMAWPLSVESSESVDISA